MPLYHFEEIQTNKQTYIKFVAVIIGLVVFMWVVWYFFDIFLGSVEDDYRNDLSESIATIKESVEITQDQLDFLNMLSNQCIIDSDLSRFSSSRARLDYVNSVLLQCGPGGSGLFINEYEPTEAFDPDQVRPNDSNPFNSNE